MKRLLVVCSVFAVAGVVYATPFGDKNGRDINGRDINGRDINGRDINGRDINGTAITGTTVELGTKLMAYQNGVKKTGTQMIGAHLQVNGDSGTYDLWVDTATTLPAPNTDVWAYTISGEYWQNGCTHTPAQQGVRLNALCGNLEGDVCEADNYCCTTRWDSLCVSEFQTRYQQAQAAGEEWRWYWYRHSEDSICGQDGDEDGYWRSYRPLRKGIFIAGHWDRRAGVPGGGAKLAGGITFACLPSPNRMGGGGIAKCVTNGYKPWISGALNTMHQACVRMYRADFCGDGVSWTQNGTPVDLWDNANPQQQAASTFGMSGWIYEAVWTPSGATHMMDWTRTRSSPDYLQVGSRNLAQYQTWKQATYGSSYCSGDFLNSTFSGCAENPGDGTCRDVYSRVEDPN